MAELVKKKKARNSANAL